MHPLVHLKQHILLMGLLQLQITIITRRLHLAQFTLHLVDSPVMVSQFPSRQLVTHKLVLPVMRHTHLHSKLTPSSRLLTLQVMATQPLKILLTAVVLHHCTVQQQVGSQVMFNPHQLKLGMNSLTHNQLVMLLYKRVLQLRMARHCRPSLLTRSMTPPKFMVHHDDDFCIDNKILVLGILV